MTTVVPEIRSHIGRSQPRRDAREKLRGEAQFVGDLLVPRMLHGKVLRSPIAHGRIVSIDTSAAERLPGVVCVLTGADLHDLDPYYGHAIKDRPILAIDKVRFHGEQVAAVAAETVAAAAAAVELIEVEYEELPVVADVADAVADGAPLVTDRESKPGLFHGLGEIPPRDGNVCYRYRIDRGELESVFARADIVVEGEYTFPSVYQYAMETHTVIAQVEGDEITLWATCQHPFLVRAEIADLFGVPVANVRIQVPYLGGGFGSKSYTKMEPLTVALARKAGRPVRIQNRVAESMVTTRRHNMTCRMRTAATADGRLLARDVECLFDTGAYADNGPRVVATAGDAAPGPYRWAAYRVDAVVRLHEPRAGRLLPRVRRDAPPVDRRVAGRRGRPARRPRSARSPPREPLRPGRGGARRRQTARRRPRRRRREGGRRGRLGRGEGPVGRPRRLGRTARRRRTPGVERHLPPRGGRSRGRARQHDRDGPGPADGIRADRRRGDRRRSRPGDGTRRRHPLQPVRPLDRSEPVDHHRGPRRPAGGGRHPRPARGDRRHLTRSGRTTTSS